MSSSNPVQPNITCEDKGRKVIAKLLDWDTWKSSDTPDRYPLDEEKTVAQYVEVNGDAEFHTSIFNDSLDYDDDITLTPVVHEKNPAPCKITIVDYSGLSTETVTIRLVTLATGATTDVVLTEGTDWTAGTSDTATATSLTSAINNDATLSQYLTATSSGAVITILNSGTTVGLGRCTPPDTSDMTVAGNWLYQIVANGVSLINQGAIEQRALGSTGTIGLKTRDRGDVH